MDSSDEEEERTFVRVLSEKYNPENFPYGQGVVVLPSPPGSPVKGNRKTLHKRLKITEMN